MKTIFDTATTHDLIARINTLQPDHKARWGKMNAYQMLKHCTLSEEMVLGHKQYKRLFAGRLFGKMALKGLLKNENPVKKNQPTHPDMKISGTGNFGEQQTKWITLLKEYAQFNNETFMHPFFGNMTREQIGSYVYKHTDHHLRQFGA